METQRQEFRIGIMVLACLVSLTMMTVIFGKRSSISFGGEESTIQVRFQRAPGIKRNVSVYKNGIQIGKVTRVELVNNDREVEVTISLDRNRKIYTDEQCRVQQSLIMGDSSLEFVKRLNFTGEIKEIDPAIPLVGVDSSDFMSGFNNIEGDLSRAIQNVAEAAEHIGTFVERINNVIGSPDEFKAWQDNFGAVVEETRETMASIKQTTDGISRFVNDPEIQNNVRKVIADLPGIIDHSRTLIEESTLFVNDTRVFVQDARTLIEKGSASMDNLTDGLEKITRTLDVITKIAAQVEDDVPEIVTAVKRSAVRLEGLFSELTLVVENFRQADGTVKRLIRDPEAYEKILATLDNVERITEEIDWMLRVDVKPITHNVKVLTDKAARDPAIFIRNLLQKEPPVKTLPVSFGGGGMLFASSFPRTVVIDGDVVEIISEVPVPVNRMPQSQTQQSRTQQSRAANPIRYEVPLPSPSMGRIVNIDPRYPE